VRPTYARATWLFLRLLGLTYLLAFWSLHTQILGLIGQGGILPAGDYMDRAREFFVANHAGVDRFRQLPTLCWLSASDTFLRGLSLGGIVLAAFLVAGILPAVVVPLLWIDYLSLSVVAREFLGYQWDALLLEAGLLAMALAPWVVRERARTPVRPPQAGVWLMWWLVFRLMFGSGLAKLASGDPTWRNLTALAFHYETQPIPTPLAWYVHQLPTWFARGSTAGVLAIELCAPFFIVGPRRLRQVALGLFVGLQAVIALTGNYAFFNLLSASLCLFLLDDTTFGMTPASAVVETRWRIPHVRRGAAIGLALITVPVSALALTNRVGVSLPIAPLVAPVADLIAPLRSVNAYGLFAVMTTTRPEIIVEGSEDGVEWKAYEFAYKAGDLKRRPPWVAPHQPRLDWQMWFAALGRYEEEPWFDEFCQRLLTASPDVLRLLAHDPFGGRPPRFVRAALFQYRFSDRATRRAEGVWWTRERLGDYSPVIDVRRAPL
jgi:hypothetical protein